MNELICLFAGLVIFAIWSFALLHYLNPKRGWSISAYRGPQFSVCYRGEVISTHYSGEAAVAALAKYKKDLADAKIHI